MVRVAITAAIFAVVVTGALAAHAGPGDTTGTPAGVEDTADLRAATNLRVRVHLVSGKWRDGGLVTVLDSALVLAHPAESRLDTLSLSSVAAVYRDRGRGPTKDGLIIGGIGGFLVGALVARTLERDCEDRGELTCLGSGFVVLSAGLGGAGAGMVTGSLAFHRWQRIYGRD